MKWRRDVSDREFVERVERIEQRWRKRVAILMLVLSLTYFVLAVWFYQLVSKGVFPLVPDEIDRTSFEIGLMMGYFAGKLFFFMIFLCITGVYLLFACRKDRLLAALFHRLDELGELDADGQRMRET